MKVSRYYLAVVIIMSWAASFAVSVSASDGTRMGEIASALQPGEWGLVMEDTPDLNQAVNTSGCSQHILTFAVEAKWNPLTKELFYTGGGCLADWRFIKFYVGDQGNPAGQWAVVAEPAFSAVNAGHSYDYQAIDIVRQKYSVSTREYDIATGSTANLPSVNAGRAHPAYEYFPGLGLVVFNDSNLAVLKTGSNAWRQIGSYGAKNTLHSIAVYNEKDNVLLFGGGDYNGDSLWIMDSSENVSALSSTPLVAPAISTNGGKGAVPVVDPVSGSFLFIDTDLSLWELRHKTQEWTRVQSDISDMIPAVNDFVAATVSSYGVVAFLVGREGSRPNRLWLYKHAHGVHNNARPNSPTNLIAR